MNHKSNVAIFAGIFFIFLGLATLIEVLFGVYLPIGRIFFGFLLCYLGYYLITGYRTRCPRWYEYHRCNTHNNTTTMDSVILEINEGMLRDKQPFSYATTLGSTIIDMTHIYQSDKQPKTQHTIILDTTLGNTTLKINKNYSFCIHIHGSLGHITLPNGQHGAFKKHTFCHPEQSTTYDLEIHAHTVLGSLDIALV